MAAVGSTARGLSLPARHHAALCSCRRSCRPAVRRPRSRRGREIERG
uniref:Uncharacterized protein n=1 Tax=Arundo donax TaxID=35708 RepID=A0A0A9FDF8_ARUDO